jgi:NADH-quinone oxidoreductase subunit M
MVQKVFFGPVNDRTAGAVDIHLNERLALAVLVVIIFAFGVYPQPLLNVTNEYTQTIINNSTKVLSQAFTK